MNILHAMRRAVPLALVLCAAAPAHAQLDLLRRLVPQVGAVSDLHGARQHGDAVNEILQRQGSGDAAQALRLAEALVARDRDPRPESLLSPRGNFLKQSVGLATGLNEGRGQYARAIELQQMLLAMRSDLDERADPVGRFSILVKIGELQEKAGDAAAARRSCEQALALPAGALPLAQPWRAPLLARLGRTAAATGDEALAEASLLRAIEEAPDRNPPANKQAGGETSYFEAMTVLRSAAGRVAEMRAGFGAGQAIMDANGELVPAADTDQDILKVAGPFTDLAALYYRQRKADALQVLYGLKFLAYAEGAERAAPEVFGPPAQLEREHARFGAYLAGLGRQEAAEQAFGRALRLNALRLRLSAAQMAPELLAPAFAGRRQIVDLLVSLRLAEAPAAPRWRPALGELLQSKGLQAEFFARRARAIDVSSDRDVRRLAAQIAALDDAAPGATAAAAAERHARRAGLVLALQAKIGATLPPLAFEEGERFIGQVQQRLGAETLVSLSLFAPFDFAGQSFGAPHYLAARVTRDAVKVVDLGAGARLDLLAARLRADLGQRPAAAAARSVPASARALHDAVLKPLLGAVPFKGAFVADLDGTLALVPMEVLADGAGHYMIESGAWRYVGSARALLRAAEPGAPAAAPVAVVLADPAYDLAQPAQAAAAPAGTRSAALRGLHFQPLPQTLEEGKAVAAALERAGNRVALYAGADARRQVLDTLHGPRYLHIATHGFFVEQAGVERTQATGTDGKRYLIEYQAAGMSSGLALAGANAALAGGGGDGVLFAAQLRRLDLAGTELAVLSACDTSVGAVSPGEGVDSLRQALELAGARSMMTSLWPVSDLETRVLMTDFYTAVAAGAAKPDALREAKLRLKQRAGHPFYWASFVLTGMR